MIFKEKLKTLLKNFEIEIRLIFLSKNMDVHYLRNVYIIDLHNCQIYNVFHILLSVKN